MIKVYYENYEIRGHARWVKRGTKRFLHSRCSMEYDAKGEVGYGGKIFVDCGHCGKTILISNGNSDKPLIHKCTVRAER